MTLASAAIQDRTSLSSRGLGWLSAVKVNLSELQRVRGGGSKTEVLPGGRLIRPYKGAGLGLPQPNTHRALLGRLSAEGFSGTDRARRHELRVTGRNMANMGRLAFALAIFGSGRTC